MLAPVTHLWCGNMIMTNIHVKLDHGNYKDSTWVDSQAHLSKSFIGPGTLKRTSSEHTTGLKPEKIGSNFDFQIVSSLLVFRQQNYFFVINLSSSGYSHVNSFFSNATQEVWLMAQYILVWHMLALLKMSKHCLLDKKWQCCIVFHHFLTSIFNTEDHEQTARHKMAVLCSFSWLSNIDF